MGIFQQTRAGGGRCDHLERLASPVAARSEVCEECGKRGPLRVCLSCGHVGCCDSARAHARAHAVATGHPLIKALPNGFVYCFDHDEYL
jgi:CPA2 family monovalent cation:H+ antiporter-2